MEQIKIKVEKEQTGVRLDAFLAGNIEEATRSFLQKRIENADVEIDGRSITQKSYKVQPEQLICVNIPEPQIPEALPEDLPIDIVYEDNDVVLVNKARGMVVHPAAGNYNGTLVNALLYHCGELSAINGVIRPGIVHRIDKDTTGLLVAAKNAQAHLALAEQLKEHSMTRVYEAITHGILKHEEGTISAAIGRHPSNRLKMAVISDGKQAITHYRVVARYERFTHIKARLETGRTHQIRVHMAHIHHPLAGDFLYGPSQKVYGEETQLLHAGVLGFVHPRTGEYMEFQVPPPKNFEQVLDKLHKTNQIRENEPC